MINRRAMVGVFIFTLGLDLLVWSLVGVRYAYAGRIPFGVTINGVSYSGLLPVDATNKLQALHDIFAQQTLTLSITDHTYQPALDELGYELDTTRMINEATQAGASRPWYGMILVFLGQSDKENIPLRYKLDTDKFTGYYSTLRNSLPLEPKDIALDYQNGAVVVQPSETGIILDQPTMQSAIEAQIPAIMSGKTQQVTIPAQVMQPNIAREDQIAAARSQLEKLLAKSLVVQVENYTTEIKPADIYAFINYIQKDNQLAISFDETQVKAKATDIAKQVAIKPQAKTVNSVDNSTISEGQDGRKLDVADTTNKILDRLDRGEFDSPLVLTTQKVDRNVVTQGPEYTLGRDPGKYIDIDLSQQRLNIIEGSTLVQGFSISTGKWSTPTPVGEFAIQNHVPTAWSARYKLYMDNWMAITPDGLFGIHQLPRWPGGKVEGANHIGTPVSHGCIRLSAADAPVVYAWATNGTKVFIHE